MVSYYKLVFQGSLVILIIQIVVYCYQVIDKRSD